MDPKYKPLRIFGVPFEVQDRLYALEDEDRGFIESRRIDELIASEALFEKVRAEGGVITRPPLDPLPQLVVTHPDFAAEAFITNGKLLYISRALREALAFSESEVQYLPIDDSLSLPRIRKKQYSIIDFRIWENAADWERSTPGDWADLFGSHEGAFRPAFDPPPRMLVLRDDFEPSASVFYVVGAGEGPFITAEKARQIEHLTAIDLREPPAFAG